MSAKVGLPEVVENLECFWLQRMGFLQFELGLAILFRRGEQNTETKVQPDVIFVLGGKRSGKAEARGVLSGLKVAAN